MKRFHQETQMYPSTSMKKPKSMQACTSCRKHKTRCEVLDTSTSPVRCHRCQVIGVQCSYEDTLVPLSPPALPSTNIVKNDNSGMHDNASPRPDPPFPLALPAKVNIWEFVGKDSDRLDWSAPILAIQNLTRLPAADFNPAQFISSPREVSLANILPEDQVRYLLELFDQKYTPWLNFKPIRHSNSSLLDTICCTIASRHLDSRISQPDLKIRLQSLTEDLIAKMIFNPRISESVEAIQALLILSLWEPIGGPPQNDGRDGRVLLASAVSMALNLRLNEASAKADALRKSTVMNGHVSEDDIKALDDTLENARLWISVTNAESMLCLGTGRVPLSRRSIADKKMIQFPESFVDLPHYRDLRLCLIDMQSTIAEEGVGLHLRVISEMNDWYDKITVILESLKRGRRLLLPLPIILDHERFYFHILHIYDGICRLLVLYHASWQARAAVGHIPPGKPWHHHFRPRGVNVAGDWGRDMIQTSEAILVYVLQADSGLLGTAPDNFFSMVALVAGLLVGAKFLVEAIPGTDKPMLLLGGSDLLLAKAVSHLSQAACGPGHSARKCALLIKGMIAKWENRGSIERPTGSLYSMDAYSPQSSSDGTSSLDSFYPTGNLPPITPPELDFSLFLNDPIVLDPEFWKDFQESQELAGGYPP
ncbi:hypothetical protein C8R44DRAFT_803189 [Mycena epipterygia]|nr:hypothetical protein C8R44DRAFT_803189 [Mycena epipterygia]